MNEYSIYIRTEDQDEEQAGFVGYLKTEMTRETLFDNFVIKANDKQIDHSGIYMSKDKMDFTLICEDHEDVEKARPFLSVLLNHFGEFRNTDDLIQ
jgi:hypothetical protein